MSDTIKIATITELYYMLYARRHMNFLICGGLGEFPQQTAVGYEKKKCNMVRSVRTWQLEAFESDCDDL